MIVNDCEIFDQKTIAENFNKVFSEMGHQFASKTPHFLISFEYFLHVGYPFLEEKPVTDDYLKKYFQTLKGNKSSGYDEVSFDVIKHISPSVFETMKYISNLSIEKDIFLDQLKVATVTPLF